MKSSFLEKVNFYYPFFEKQSIPRCYKEISLKDNNFPFLPKNVKESKPQRSFFTIVEQFPNYFSPTFFDHFKTHKLKTKLGYAIHLKGYGNVSDYINTRFKRTQRKVLKRALTGLETCFDISYEMFYGSIDKEKYSFLMRCLYDMIRQRFKDRNTKNKDLDNWSHHEALFFDLILLKKASLFVIYNHDTPIEISLNYNFNNIIFSSISSFDEDYSKFSLGNIEIYKQLEWCLENGFDLFDMGFGDFDYKRRWSNLIYDFETHVVSSNPLGFLVSYFYKTKNSFVDFLISKDINLYFHKLLSFLKKKQLSHKNDWGESQNLTIKKAEENSIQGDLIPIDIQDDNYSFLRRPLYDFLYLEKLHINTIGLYKNGDSEFIVKVME